MKLVQYDNGGQIGVGVQVGEEVHYTGYNDMLSLIRDEERGLDRAREAMEHGRPVRFDKIIAPITNSGKIWGSGPNYLSHGKEIPNGSPVTSRCGTSSSSTSAVTGPFDDIVIPPNDDVIKRLPGGPRASASTVSQSTGKSSWPSSSARPPRTATRRLARSCLRLHDHQRRRVEVCSVLLRPARHGQELRHLQPDGSMHRHQGRVPDLTGMLIESYVNGERMQHEYIRDQLNPPAVAIEWISSVIRLDPATSSARAHPPAAAHS